MSGGVGAKEIGYVDSKGRKIGTAGEKAGDRHNDIIDERLDDGGKSTTDGDTDGEIDDVAAINEFFEFVNKSAFGDLFDRVAKFVELL